MAEQQLDWVEQVNAETDCAIALYAEQGIKEVPCDCLNRCGDDPDVANYKVPPCAYRFGQAKRELAELCRQVRLYEDANRWREHCAKQGIKND